MIESQAPFEWRGTGAVAAITMLRQRWFDLLAKELQSRRTITFRSAQLETVQSLVCAGVGLSLIPAMAMSSGRGRNPEYRSLQAPRPERKIVALWPKQRPLGRAAEELLNVVAACPLSKSAASR